MAKMLEGEIVIPHIDEMRNGTESLASMSNLNACHECLEAWDMRQVYLTEKSHGA